MSVKYTATWTCDGCAASMERERTGPHWPEGWVLLTKRIDDPKRLDVGTLKETHYCAKCAKEKGL